jgi:hypothetical protein
MKTIEQPESDIEYVKFLVENDITEAASNLSFFYERKIEPRDYIDQMIAIAKMFGLNFWEIIDINCSDFESKRLHVLYEGKSLSKFISAN